MTAKRDRSGFSLVETMVASAIASLAFAAIAATFIFCQRMFRITMAEAEISLKMRDIRDKLLFRAGPGLNSGLLTGKASFFNERRPHTDYNISWFKPDGFRLRQEWQQTVDLPLIRLNLGSPDTEIVHDYGWILLPQ